MRELAKCSAGGEVEGACLLITKWVLASRKLWREAAISCDGAVHEEAVGGEERPQGPDEQVPALQRRLRRDQQALLGGRALAGLALPCPRGGHIRFVEIGGSRAELTLFVWWWVFVVGGVHGGVWVRDRVGVAAAGPDSRAARVLPPLFAS
jgi:hypothetical protein